MTIHEGLTTEIQKLAPSAVIELFVLDATSIGGEVFRFHAGTNQLSQNIVWQGETYLRFPITATGFELTGQGQIPRPRLTVSNVLSAMTTILIALNDLIGAKLIRKRTLAKFLDAENFSGGVNPTEDDTAEFPEDIYYVDRKSNEDKDIVEFELASSLDLVGVNLPRRQVIQNICIWKYRGVECGFTGPPLFDINDQPIDTSGLSAEGELVLSSYQDYLDSIEALSEAQSTLSANAHAKDAACEIVKLQTEYDINGENDLVYTVKESLYDKNNTNIEPGTLTAYWDGDRVTLGTTYRQGKLKFSGTVGKYYEIQRWGINSGTCTPATTEYNAALSARNAAVVARDAAFEAFQEAFDDLPDDDPLYLSDRCGKRLSSCKIRFGENNPLPFGGFPGVGLTQ